MAVAVSIPLVAVTISISLVTSFSLLLWFRRPAAEDTGRVLSFFKYMNDDRHNPQVSPRNTTNPPVIPIFSNKPTKRPSWRPSKRRTKKPSKKPSIRPAPKLTKRPTLRPSQKRSKKPSLKPSIRPSANPSTRPTPRKTVYPTNKPSPKPDPLPSSRPSEYPIYKQSSRPSLNPSKRPASSSPNFKPSSHPTKSLCLSSNGDFGFTNVGKDNSMHVSYTYELYLKRINRTEVDASDSTTVADTVTLLEVAISNQLIASLFTSCSSSTSLFTSKNGRNLQSSVSDVILGLSSSPSDIATKDACSTSNITNEDSSCHVVLGRLTLFMQDPSVSYSLYSTSLEVLKMSMNSGVFNNLPNILRVMYIDNSDGKQILPPFSPSKSNVIPILSAFAGFFALLFLLLLFIMRRGRSKIKTYIFKDNSTHSDSLFYGRDSERLGIDPLEAKVCRSDSSIQQRKIEKNKTLALASNGSSENLPQDTPTIWTSDELLYAECSRSVNEVRTDVKEEKIMPIGDSPYNPHMILEPRDVESISPITFTDMSDENILYPKGEIPEIPLLSRPNCIDGHKSTDITQCNISLEDASEVNLSYDINGYMPLENDEEITMIPNNFEDSRMLVSEHKEKYDFRNSGETLRTLVNTNENVTQGNDMTLTTAFTTLLESIPSPSYSPHSPRRFQGDKPMTTPVPIFNSKENNIEDNDMNLTTTHTVFARKIPSPPHSSRRCSGETPRTPVLPIFKETALLDIIPLSSYMSPHSSPLPSLRCPGKTPRTPVSPFFNYKENDNEDNDMNLTTIGTAPLVNSSSPSYALSLSRRCLEKPPRTPVLSTFLIKENDVDDNDMNLTTLCTTPPVNSPSPSYALSLSRRCLGEPPRTPVLPIYLSKKNDVEDNDMNLMTAHTSVLVNNPSPSYSFSLSRQCLGDPPRTPVLPIFYSKENDIEDMDMNLMIAPNALVENKPSPSYASPHSTRCYSSTDLERDINTPEWLKHQGTRLKSKLNKSDIPLCALCNFEAHISTTFCHCGDPECKKVAHTACLLGGKSPLPSISYPGTPPPSLPPVFCSGGVHRVKRLRGQSLIE